MADYIYTKADGSTVECYGTLEFGTNFEIVCNDEYGDGIVADYDGSMHWGNIVRYMLKNYRTDIVQIEAC